MPNLDGYETLSAIRGDISTSKIPFIFMTGDKRHSQKGARMGADGYLTKPFISSELMRAIRSSLGGDPKPQVPRLETQRTEGLPKPKKAIPSAPAF